MALTTAKAAREYYAEAVRGRGIRPQAIVRRSIARGKAIRGTVSGKPHDAQAGGRFRLSGLRIKTREFRASYFFCEQASSPLSAIAHTRGDVTN